MDNFPPPAKKLGGCIYAPKIYNKGMDYYIEPEFHKEYCRNCGKLMVNQVDSATGKLSPYIFHCECMPPEMMMAVG